MAYTNIEFIIFLVIIISFISIVKNNTIKKSTLLIASYYFYAYWDYRFLFLLFIPTILDFQIGRLLEYTSDLKRRKLLLFLSLAINLGVLGFFKYYNFFINSMNTLFVPLNFEIGTLSLILPIGISFYTFRVMSYTIDVYARKTKACTNFLDFALFVAFFPTLLAGPIVRASYLLQQFKEYQPVNKVCLAEGFRLFVIGLFLKVFIADKIGSFVNFYWENFTAFDSKTTWLAAIAYSLQIYCDFAGYSSMAIGVGRLLGYDLNTNFNFPYLATDMRDFWRRWHITLSEWIRDYIYIPLGGSRKGFTRTHANIFVSMILCGLWHGAAWTFIFWGILHGFALIVNRVWARHTNTSMLPLKIKTFADWLITMLTIIVGWIFFRSSSIEQAMLIIEKMFFPSPGISFIQPFAIFVIFSFSVIHIIEWLNVYKIHHLYIDRWYTPAILFSMIWLLVIFYPQEFSPFIYGNF